MPRKTAAPARSTPAAKSSTTPSTTRSRSAQADAAEKNKPLVDDIRLLGRILGEVIREQEGREAYELVEQIRQLSVAYRLKQDAPAGKALDRLLKNLSGDQAVSVIRAFSYFSHLANLAEDRHHVRRREHHERQGNRQEGSLAMCFERLEAAGHRAHDIAHTLQHAYIAPVLTAHPTEVQRKSILDAERAIATLVEQRDGLQTARELALNEALVRARVASYRMPCRNAGDKLQAMRQHFTIRPSNESRYTLKREVFSLREFLGLTVKPDELRAQFDFNTMACPFKVNYTSYGPSLPNEVSAGKRDPNRLAFLNWLRERQLGFKNDKEANDLFGRVLQIEVPCGTLNLQGKAAAS